MPRPRILKDSTESEDEYMTKKSPQLSAMEKELYNFLRSFSCPVSSCEEVGKAYTANHTSGRWLHVFINSLATLTAWTSTLGIKVHAGCACMEQDRNHPHVHLLVELERSQYALKKYWQRKKITNLKYRTKKIICGDHLVGVYRYLGCSRGGERNMKKKQLVHVHFNRQVSPEFVKHSRGFKCKEVRNYIANQMFPSGKILNHEPNTCKCRNSRDNKRKYRKRRSVNCDFYKTPTGIELATKSAQRNKLEVQLQSALLDKDYQKIQEISTILATLQIQIRDLMQKKSEFVLNWNANLLMESDCDMDLVSEEPLVVRKSKRRRISRKPNLKEDDISITPSSDEDDYYSP